MQEQYSKASTNLAVASINTLESIRTTISEFLERSCFLFSNRHCHYLLQYQIEPRVLFFDDKMTNILHDLELPGLPNRHCLTLTAKSNNSKLLVCLKDKIDLYLWPLGGELPDSPDSLVIRDTTSFSKDEWIVYVSKAIIFHQLEYYVAYSNKDAFYLITVTPKGNSFRLQCQNLISLNSDQGWFSWRSYFGKNNTAHYDAIQILLLRIQGCDLIKMVTIRDNLVQVWEINPEPSNKKNRPTIRKLDQKILTKQEDTPLMQIVPLKDHDQTYAQSEEIVQFLAIHSKGKEEKQNNHDVHMSRVGVTVRQNSAQITHADQIFSFRCRQFQAATFKNNLITNFYSSQIKQYCLHNFSLDYLQQNLNALNNNNTALTFIGKTLLSQNQNESINNLVVINTCQIFKYLEFTENRSKSREVEVRHSDDMDRLIQNGNYRRAYQELQKQLEQIQFQELEGMTSDEETKNINVLKFIGKCFLDEQLRKQIKEELRQKLEIREKSLQEQATIEDLIELTARDSPDIFVERIFKPAVRNYKKFQKTMHYKQYMTLLRHCFAHVSLVIIDSIKMEQVSSMNLELYKDILTQYSTIAPTRIKPELLTPLVPLNQEQYIRDLIIEYKLYDAFIFFFVRKQITLYPPDEEPLVVPNKVIFSIEILRKIADDMKQNNEALLANFLKGLILQAYQEWQRMKSQIDGDQNKKKEYEQFIQQKITTLVKALSHHAQYITPHLDQTYPGISALFFISYARRHKTDKIQELALKASKPSTAYILNLSTIDVKRQEAIALLDTNRLCHQIKESNLTADDFIEQTKEGRGGIIKREIWEQWKSSHPDQRTQIEQIEPKFNLQEVVN